MFKVKSRYATPRDYSSFVDQSLDPLGHGEFTFKKGKDR